MSEYLSVDDFVAQYLDNCAADQLQQTAAPPAQVPLNGGGLPFAGANGLQTVYQPQVYPQQPQLPSSALPSTQQQGLPPASYASAVAAQQWGVHHQPAPAPAPAAVGGYYMQPYDQAVQQQPCATQHVENWQQQQQQLQLLHQQEQQQAMGMQVSDFHNMATTSTAGATVAAAAAVAAAAVAGQSGAPPQTSKRAGGNTSGSSKAEASSTTADKRNSRSKSSSRSTGGRRAKQDAAATEEGVLLPDVDAGQLSNNLGHVSSAPPLLTTAAGGSFTAAAAAAAAAATQHSMSASFTAAYNHKSNLSDTVAALRQAQTKQHQQQAAAAAGGGAQQDEGEPDMSHLTVMQRYHARRKLAVQRMEREVEEKIAQLAVLEQENRQLKWQAHILENMLLDMDKQVELMSAEELPDASQWLTLLGMGATASGGGTGRITRKLDRMLEGASAVDITDWSAQDCRRRWLSYLEQLHPLVAEAEAAQVAYRAAQGNEQQSGSMHGEQQQQPQRRPRRAAAAAAVAVIKQEAAEVLGVAPLPVSPVANSIPDVPLPQSSHSLTVTPPAADPGRAGSNSVQPMEGIQPANSAGSNAGGGGAAPPASEHSAGSLSGSEFSHGPNTEGVPPALLSRIEELVMTNFFWLLAIMTRNPVLTYEFISVDLVEGRTPLPPQHHKVWSDALERSELTLEQLQEAWTCLQVSRRCMAKVIEERTEITAAMQSGRSNRPQTDQQTIAWLASDMLNQNQVDVTVDRMQANVRKESVVRNLVGFYCINVLSLYQLAKLSVACSPWFCMAWRIADAVEIKLNKLLANDAAAQRQQQAFAGGHNTRSSTRVQR